MVVVVLSGTLEVVCVVVVVVVVVVVGCVGCGGQGQLLISGEGGPLTQVSQLRSHEDQISTNCVSIYRYLLGEGAAVVQQVAEGVEVCEPVALRQVPALGLARARGARHLPRDQG